MKDPENELDPGTIPAAGSNGKANGKTNGAANASTVIQAAIQPDDLHDLFEGSLSAEGSEEEDPLAALRNDPNYSALIKELEYIAAQARLLFQPSEQTPSDDVWEKIQSQLPTKPEN